jgi:hypothetical protein
MGRKSTYTEEKAQEICDRLSLGETLVDICKSDHLPTVDGVYLWKNTHEQFNTDFARAREAGFDVIANDCLRIADDGFNDTYETEDGTRTNTDVIARSKLRVETRLKLLAKWDWKRYGEKVQTELSGSVDVASTVSVVFK